MICNKVAKRCQDMLSDVIYRTYLHQWTCHPDQEDAIRARKTNEILSDVGPSSHLAHLLLGIDCWAMSCGRQLDRLTLLEQFFFFFQILCLLRQKIVRPQLMC